MTLIYEALTNIMREIEPISKGRKNQSQGYNFRGIEDMYNFLQPLLAKHGVVTVPELLQHDSQFVTTAKGGQMEYVKITLKVHFYAKDGSSVFAIVPGAGTDSGDKAMGKAMSYAHKYALIQTFCIPTEDLSDGDEESHKFVQQAPALSNATYNATDVHKRILMAHAKALGVDVTNKEIMKKISDDLIIKSVKLEDISEVLKGAKYA